MMGRLSELQKRYLPEPLHGTRGLIASMIAVVVVAAGSITIWDSATGDEDSQASAESGESRSLDSILDEHGSTAGASEDGEGEFFPSDTTTDSSSPSAPAAGPTASELGEEDCGSGVAVGPNTTCPFALNVARAYRASGGSTVTAHSPARNRDYEMTCTPGPPAVCRGGDDASIFID